MKAEKKRRKSKYYDKGFSDGQNHAIASLTTNALMHQSMIVGPGAQFHLDAWQMMIMGKKRIWLTFFSKTKVLISCEDVEER